MIDENITAINEFAGKGLLNEVLLDCGAFKYSKTGKEIPVEDYIDYIKSVPFPVSRFFALDVIGDPDATMENLYKMYDAGLKPIPVWQKGVNRSQIDEMYDLSDLVAIGGVVGRPQLMLWAIRKLWPKGKRVHILGLGSPREISHLRPHSVDCSSFASASRWGTLILYGGGNRWLQPQLSYGTKPTAKQREVIRRCGYNEDVLRYKSIWYDYQKVGKDMLTFAPIPQEISMIAWQWFSLDQRARGLTRVFISISAPSDIQIIPAVVEKAKRIFEEDRDNS